MRTKALTALLWTSLLMVIATIDAANAGCRPEDVIPGQYLIRYSDSAPGAATENTFLRQNIGARAVSTLHSRPRFLKSRVLSDDRAAKIPPSVFLFRDSSGDNLGDLASQPGVLSVEPDCRVPRPLAVGSDFPGHEMHHARLETAGAWALIDSTFVDVKVSISDTGVDLNHEDLREMLWVNMTEINGISGYDDDQNGCVDDFHGCDFSDKDGNPTPSDYPGSYHGTHVAGIIGAAANGIGVTGITPKVQLVAAKGFPDFGDAALSDLLASIYYSVRVGARVINCSWGMEGAPTSAELDAFQFAIDSGVVPVVAAGNERMNAALSTPASIDSVITVGAVNSEDQLSTFSNFGVKLDLVAPGGDRVRYGVGLNEGILSTLPGDSYGALRGTSMAAPMVAGAAALVISSNPNLSVDEVTEILKTSADLIRISTPEGDQVVPRLNVATAIRRAKNYIPKPQSFELTPCRPGEACQQPPKQLPASPSSNSNSTCAFTRNSAPIKAADITGLIFLLAPLGVFGVLRKSSRS